MLKDGSLQGRNSTYASMLLIEQDIKVIVVVISAITYSIQAIRVQMVEHPASGNKGEGGW